MSSTNDLEGVSETVGTSLSSSSSSQDAAVYMKPKTRQRLHKRPPVLPVPDMNENAEERKRVLNVLAQRRYRERKRQAKGSAAEPSAATTRSARNSNRKPRPATQELQHVNPGACPGDGTSEIDDPLLFQDIFGSGLSTDVVLLGEATENLNLDLSLQGWGEPMNCASLDATTTTIMPGLVEGAPPVAIDADAGQQLDFESDENAFALSSSSSSSSSQTPSYQLPLLISGNSSSSSSATPNDSSSSPTTTDALSITYNNNSSNKNDVDNDDNDDEPHDFFAFPDSYHLPMAELALLRAFGRIGKRLGLGLGALWELGARSPFVVEASAAGDKAPPSQPQSQPQSQSQSQSQQRVLQLPQHLRPTRTQSTVPHHPVLDFLPWPVVRDRLITVLSLPDEARPCGGGGGGASMALVQFSYDMEHTAEGIRIWGGDVYDPRAWEVGQVLFEKWWFVFDREVVEQSNSWRRLRGAGELCVR